MASQVWSGDSRLLQLGDDVLKNSTVNYQNLKDTKTLPFRKDTQEFSANPMFENDCDDYTSHKSDNYVCQSHHKESIQKQKSIDNFLFVKKAGIAPLEKTVKYQRFQTNQ